MKYIESDDELSMRGETLLEAITQDRADGLLPFFVSFRNFIINIVKIKLHFISFKIYLLQIGINNMYIYLKIYQILNVQYKEMIHGEIPYTFPSSELTSLERYCNTK